jgi:hypothetical protein
MPKVTLKNTQLVCDIQRCISINSDSKWDKEEKRDLG